MLSAIVLAVCVFYKEVLESGLKKKVPFPIPIDLIIVSYHPLSKWCLFQQYFLPPGHRCDMCLHVHGSE